MKRYISFIFFALVFGGYCYSQNIEITVTVTNIAVNGGKVYLALFSNANSFAKETPEFAFEIPDSSASAVQVISVPSGEYVVFVFQDANKNGKMDSNFLGIPKELIGISNYSGRGYPSRNFDKQKIKLDGTTSALTMQLYKL